jgi:hypothetical protein
VAHNNCKEDKEVAAHRDIPQDRVEEDMVVDMEAEVHQNPCP